MGVLQVEGRASAARAMALPCVAMLLVYAVVFTAPQIVQTLIDDEGVSRSGAGLLMTAFSLAYAAGGVPAGALTRRLGASRVLVLGLMLAGVCAVLGAAVAWLPALVVLRLGVGLATALVLTAGIVRTVEALPPDRQPAGIGWITVSAYLGVGLANLLAPPLLGPLGWRGLVLLSGLAALAGAAAFVHAARPGGARREEHAAPPFREVLRDRRLLLVCAMLFLDLAALYGPLAWIPPYMEDVAGFDEAQRSLAGVVMALAAIPGALAAGVVARRTGRPARTAGIFIAFCVPIGALALPAGDAFPVVVLVCVLLVAGANGATVPLFALAPSVVPYEARETAAGVATTIGLGGTVVATQAGAFLIDAAGYPAAFLAFAACGLVGTALAVPLGRALRGRPAP